MRQKFIKRLSTLVQHCHFCEVNHDFASTKALQQKIGEMIYEQAVWDGIKIGDPDDGGAVKIVEVK